MGTPRGVFHGDSKSSQDSSEDWPVGLYPVSLVLSL